MRRSGWSAANIVGLVAYLLTASIIIVIGGAMRRAQQHAARSSELVRVTLASIGDAVITTDTDGRVTYMNPVAERLTGWKDGEASIIGWLLQTKGLIEIIFANILLDKQIITSETFTALLLMAVGSTMLTVPVVHPKLNRVQHRGLVNQASS